MRQRRGVEVELIPWKHHFPALVHEEVAEFVRTLQKNSFIGIELSPKGLNRYEQRLARLANQRALKPVHLTPDRWAVVEVLLECKKRNIQLVLIETNISERKQEKSLPEHTGKKDLPAVAKAVLFRDKVFAEQIIKSLSNFKGRKLPVITGGGHALNTEKILLAHSVNAHINTRIFSNEQRVKDSLLIFVRAREAAAQNKTGLFDSLSRYADKLTSESRKEDPSEVMKRICIELSTKKKKKRNRSKKKRERRSTKKSRKRLP